MFTDYMKEESLQKLMDEVIRIRFEDPKKVVELCKNIIGQSGGDYMYGKAFGEYYYAEAFYRLNRPSELIEHAINGLTIQKNYDFYELEARTYNLLGAYFVNAGDLPNALNNYLSGFELAKKYHMHHMLKIFYNNFGDLYLRLQDYKKAIYYFNRTKSLIHEHSNQMMTKSEKELMCVRFSNLIDAYLRVGEMEKAIEASNELMHIISENYYRNSSAMF